LSDRLLKKAIVRNADLPLPTFSTIYNDVLEREEIDKLFYLLRYRIVSEDRNRRSHWSPATKIQISPVPETLPYTTVNRISIEKSTSHIDVVWSFPQPVEISSEQELRLRENKDFDIWARWNTSNTTNPDAAGWTNWEFQSTVSGSVWSVSPPTGLGYNSIDVAIQIPTLVKLRDYNNNKLTLFRSLKQGI